MNEWNVGNLEGLIPILGGIYGLLLAKGILPRNARDPDKMELWRRKFGRMLKIICPLIFVFGVLQFIGVL